ncbi:MAG: D-alanine transaminase [Motiliproteus sp.]|jgi:D-alanine transaminase
MSVIVYLNGEFVPMAQARVSVMDRGFLFGDAVYEVIPFFYGIGFRLEQHLQRLQYCLDAVGIVLDLDWKPLFDRLLDLNEGVHQAVYLQISRGVMCERSLRYDEDLQPSVFAYSYPIRIALEGPLEQIAGVIAMTVTDQRWGRCDIKATGLLANILAIRQAQQQGAQEALLVRQGYLTEGASCNLFVVEQGQVYTPLMDSHALAGTTRSLLLELMSEAGICCIEQPIAEQRLAQAQEVWISSSTRGVLPVIRINDQPVAAGVPGPLWRRVAELFQQFERQMFFEYEKTRKREK